MDEGILAPIFSTLAAIGFGASVILLIAGLRNFRKRALSPLILIGVLLLPVSFLPGLSAALLGPEKHNEQFVRLTPFLDHESGAGTSFTAGRTDVSPRYFEFIYSYPWYLEALSLLLMAWGFHRQIKSMISRLIPSQFPS